MGWKVFEYHGHGRHDVHVVDMTSGNVICNVAESDRAIASLIAAAHDLLALANAVIRADRSWPRTLGSSSAEGVIIDLAHQAELIITRASMPHVAKMGEAVDQLRAGNVAAAERLAGEALNDPAAEFFGTTNNQLLAMCEGRLKDRRIVGGELVETAWPAEFLKAAAVELRRRLTFV